MFTWLQTRPKSFRRAARPANIEATRIELAYEENAEVRMQNEELIPDEPAAIGKVEITATQIVAVPLVAQVEEIEETPPPFFADADAAFLDMGEPMTPPPLPKMATESDLERRIADALTKLPPFPAREAPDRGVKLLMILRTLDQIAGDVCSVLENAQEEAGPLPVTGIPR